jgi:CRISPR-associated protein Cmr5
MARNAWYKSKGAMGNDNFVQLAKGAPALVTSNGLMQALAYWEARGKDGGKELVKIVAGWLLKKESGDHFQELMNHLHGTGSMEFALKTREALELLRWVKQFASALEKPKE